MKKTSRKNNISVKLTNDEKERVEYFAKERDLSVSEYLRMSALNHRIKPTIIQKKEISDSDIEDKLEALELFLETMSKLSPQIAKNGYVNYKEGGQYLLDLKALYQSLNAK